VTLVIREKKSAYCYSSAVLFMHAQIVYNEGQLICYISTHILITPSVKSRVMHHTSKISSFLLLLDVGQLVKNNKLFLLEMEQIVTE
jgi:hypothetical protein